MRESTKLRIISLVAIATSTVNIGIMAYNSGRDNLSITLMCFVWIMLLQTISLVVDKNVKRKCANKTEDSKHDLIVKTLYASTAYSLSLLLVTIFITRTENPTELRGLSVIASIMFALAWYKIEYAFKVTKDVEEKRNVQNNYTSL